jgi:DNA-binding response OmpR family regulator
MKHILVADDDRSIAALVARTLSGYKVTIAHNGLEALALGATASCDLLIADYLMPAITGDKLASRLRETHPAIKTLLMTGHRSFVDVDGQSVDDHIEKPFHMGELRAKVAGLIGLA